MASIEENIIEYVSTQHCTIDFIYRGEGRCDVFKAEVLPLVMQKVDLSRIKIVIVTAIVIAIVKYR